MAEFFGSQIVLIAAGLEGLALTTLAIVHEINTRPSKPVPGGVAPTKP